MLETLIIGGSAGIIFGLLVVYLMERTIINAAIRRGADFSRYAPMLYRPKYAPPRGDSPYGTRPPDSR